jgi:hypothetical protein
MEDRPRPDPLVKDRARILESLQEPILVIDRGFHVVFMNAAARRRFGSPDYESTEIYCHTVSNDPKSPCAEPGTICPVRAVFRGGAPARAVHRRRMPDGKIVHEEIVSSPLLDDDGDVAYVIEEVRGAEGFLESKEVVEHMRAELDLLRGILPTCASCKRIRTADGEWEEIERYVAGHSSAEFSHGLCPACVEKLYPGYKGSRG